MKCSKISFVKNIFTSNPRGQGECVAWQHFWKITFRDKAEKCKIHDNNISLPKYTGILYLAIASVSA